MSTFSWFRQLRFMLGLCVLFVVVAQFINTHAYGLVLVPVGIYGLLFQLYQKSDG